MKYAIILMTGLVIGLAACKDDPVDPYFEDVCTGEYSDLQLYGWRRIAGPVMAVEGVNSLGLNMETRCIRVGVSSRDVIPQAEAKLTELEIPLDAVTFHYFEGVEFAL